MIVDETLRASGIFGPAQWTLLALFSLVNVLSAFHFFAQTFILSQPNCNSSSLISNNQSDNEYTQFNTLSEELGWACEESWKLVFAQSMFYVGSVLGTFIIGVSSDYVGRRPMVVLSNLLAVLGNILTLYVPLDLPYLSLSRFIAGLAVDSNFFMMYILVMEYMSPEIRTIGLNLSIGIWYCIGSMLVPWVAIWCEEWRTFLLTISLPMLGVPVMACMIPESAQWLISKGHSEKALKNFLKIAKVNQTTISEDLIRRFKEESILRNQDNSKSKLCNGLFRTPNLRRKTCILMFKTMVLTLCYDAISRNIENTGYSPFIMFTISSATILPSCLVILFTQDRIGRKTLAVSAIFLTGLLNLIQGIITRILVYDMPYIIAGINICGRFTVNIAYNSGTQYAAELIPTQVRGQGLSLMHVVGYIPTFLSPQILFMEKSLVGMAEFILGILSLIGATLCLFLPETMGRTLPSTLEDGESFGEDERFWEFFGISKNKAKDNTVIVSKI